MVEEITESEKLDSIASYDIYSGDKRVGCIFAQEIDVNQCDDNRQIIFRDERGGVICAILWNVKITRLHRNKE